MVTESFLNKKRVFLQEYKMNFTSEGDVESVKTVYKKSKWFCPNIEVSLPMLSKNGQLFAAVDSETRHMKIYKIDKDYKCHFEFSLEMPTGKVDFSYDNRYIIFHVSPINPQDVAHVLREQDLKNEVDIMIYDMEKRAFEWVTDCQNANCYYPSFLPNGDIVYIKQQNDGKYQFIKAKRRN